MPGNVYVEKCDLVPRLTEWHPRPTHSLLDLNDKHNDSAEN